MLKAFNYKNVFTILFVVMDGLKSLVAKREGALGSSQSAKARVVIVSINMSYVNLGICVT